MNIICLTSRIDDVEDRRILILNDERYLLNSFYNTMDGHWLRIDISIAHKILLSYDHAYVNRDTPQYTTTNTHHLIGKASNDIFAKH